MRFLISVIDDWSGSGTDDEMAAIDIFNEQLQSNGHWVIAVGISSPTDATSIDNRLDAGLIESGSKLYGTEFMSGFWIIDVQSEKLATDLALAGSKACNRKVELRQIFG
jgi:hypothetical protein